MRTAAAGQAGPGDHPPDPAERLGPGGLGGERGPRRPGGPGGKDWGGPGFGSGEAMKKMLERRLRALPKVLELNDDQRQRYEAVAKDHYARIEQLMKELQEQTKLFRSHVDEILTPQQRERLGQMRQRVHQRLGRLGRLARDLRGLGGRAPELIKRAMEVLNVPRDQQEKIRDIIDQAKQRITRSEREAHRVRMDVFQEVVEGIRDVLGPEVFERLVEEIRQLDRERPRDRWDRRDRGDRQWRGRDGQYDRSRRYESDRHRSRRYEGRAPREHGRRDQGRRPAPTEPDWLW